MAQCHCPALQESIISHIISSGKDQNSKFEMQFLLSIYDTISHPLVSTWRTLFSIFNKVGLIVMNSLRFCLSGMVSYFSFILEAKVCQTKYSCLEFFSLNTEYLIGLPSSLLRNSLIILWDLSWFVVIHFFLLVSRSLSRLLTVCYNACLCSS